MPADFDRCVMDVSKQFRDKGMMPDMAKSRAFAVCTAQFKKAGKKFQTMTPLTFNYNVPIAENAYVNDEFIIKGVAINATTTSNNHMFLEEELEEAAPTLKGVPLLVDHDNRVESIKGRVKEGNFDSLLKAITFKANVVDEAIKGMIKDGRINSVSIGAAVKEVEEGENGILIPRGIQFKELSLVAVPADDLATFTTAMHEAYETINKSNLQMKGGERIMSEENQLEESKSEEFKKKLELAEKKIAEYKAKERKTLEKEYNSLCEKKKVKAMDISEMESSMIETLMTQIKDIEISDVREIEIKEVEIKENKVENKIELEETEEEPIEKYSIVEGVGSLGGGSFHIVR